jgi:hypothetical protein
MRAVLLTNLLVALFVSAAVGAQEVRQPKSAAPVKPPAGTTFTGCLTKSSISGSPTEYDLTVTSVSATGTATTSKVYRLMPAAGVNLAEHVGHRVTITGSETTATDVKQTAGSMAKQLRVRAMDIHHIAPNCK